MRLLQGLGLICLALVGLTNAAQAASDHPILQPGSKAPDFTLPGVDGKTHSLADYASSPALVIVFTCNHCPIAQMYEQRITQLAADYSKRGVAVVAIQPNAPEALRVDELDCSDISDSLEEMKIRVAYKHLDYPYLYDGETQQTARAYGPQATPHVFIFDSERRLRYEGRMDDNYRLERVKSQDARSAIEAVLAGREVAAAHAGVFGCSTKWKEKEADRLEAQRKLDSKSVALDLVSADGLKQLRANAGGRLTLVSFWATWCGSCIHEFGDMETTYRMYSNRDLDFVTVAANLPEEREGVMRVLAKNHATGRNLLFASGETTAMQTAFDSEWDSAVPYTALLGPGGKLLYRKLGSIDILELRRVILKNLSAEYEGFSNYWDTAR
jgi:peroxiredoxin